LMAELEEKMDLANLKFLEGSLEQSIIKLNNGLLDAFRKIDRLINSETQRSGDSRLGD